ncbi:MAG: PhzF family phenazine biosynthesis protein [Alphaproteobacteria bacterium]|nr:PhzF family phenazine biosynthesis protein [Alphaproteobacteria bacterium]
MKQQPVFQVDAFTDQPFGGNPAAVCPMAEFPEDALMQSIALENNLAETAFIVPVGDQDAHYHLRWFTPAIEVQLCGHATLASGLVVFNHLEPEADKVVFETVSGTMKVTKLSDGRLCLDFPNLKPTPFDAPAGLAEAMGEAPSYVLDANTGDDDLLIVYDNAQVIETLTPDPAKMAALSPYGFIVTAPGQGDIDFVSRCFFPNKGIPEDPVTGSAHCAAGPYWAERLGKASLRARQVSARGGDLWLEVSEARVKISGFAVEVMQGTLFLP